MAEPRQDCGSPARPLKAESPQRLLSAAESHLTQGRDSLLEATCIPPLIQVEFAAPPPPPPPSVRTQLRSHVSARAPCGIG